jgi:hypothetical protein
MDRDLLVDVSNVCKDEYLGGAHVSWARLDKLMNAWRKQVNPDSRPLYVADDSLSREMRDPQSRERWGRMIRSGDLVSVPDADELILRLAAETGAAVLARDAYLGHRRRHTWVQGDDEHFWRWEVDDSGDIAIILEPMTVAGDYTMTSAMDKDTRKRLGYRRSEHEVLLQFVYRCANPICVLSSSPVIPIMPAIVNDAAVCPECRRPLRSRGPRPAARRLKLMVAGKEAAEEILEEEDVLVVGRSSAPGCWDIAAVIDAHLRLPNNLIRLRLRGGQVVAEPIAEEQVVAWQRFDPGKQLYETPRALDTSQTLLARDRLLISATVRIEQSARSYVVDPERY